MAHKLFHLTQKLYSTPHLISRRSFEAISQYLETRNADLMMPMEPMDGPEEAPDDLDDISGVGIVEVYGTLTYKPTVMQMLCGGCSYESILECVDSCLEGGATCIVLCVDSGGGEAYGAFETAQMIRQKCDAAGARLIGYIDGDACSAAYALVCVCDEVIGNPQSEAGSIGVLIRLMDQSEYLKKEGLKPIFVSAGAEKIPFTEDGGFRPEFIADLQYKVDYLYNEFANHVSTYTGLSVDDVKATEAKTYLAKDALSLGLINKIMTKTEFVDYIVAKQKGVVNA